MVSHGQFRNYFMQTFRNNDVSIGISESNEIKLDMINREEGIFWSILQIFFFFSVTCIQRVTSLFSQPAMRTAIRRHFINKILLEQSISKNWWFSINDTSLTTQCISPRVVATEIKLPLKVCNEFTIVNFYILSIKCIKFFP